MRLAIVEDDSLLVDLLCSFSKRLGHTVVAKAQTAADGLQAVLSSDPELVILDLLLPNGYGLDIVHPVRQRNQAVKFLVLTGRFDACTIFDVESAGVDGFLCKPAAATALLGNALKTLAEGRKFFPDEFVEARKAQKQDPLFFHKILSERERTVLGLIGRGLSDVEIAQALQIAVRTAETHRSNLLHRLNLPSTPKLMAFAIERGFVR